MNRSKNSMQPVWLGFGLVCFVIFIAVISVQLSKPEERQNPRPVQNEPNGYDIINDVDQAPTRRLLKIMLPNRITQEELQVLSHQIRNLHSDKKYGYFSISYVIPEMPESHGYWARAAFKSSQPEEIEILGLKIPQLKQLIKVSQPSKGRILGDWIIEEISDSSRRVLITETDGKYFYHLRRLLSSDFETVELKVIENNTRFSYLDGSENTIYRIKRNGDLELSSPERVFAIGHPVDSYDVPEI